MKEIQNDEPAPPVFDARIWLAANWFNKKRLWFIKNL
jgi:hypothetical protein